jgi:hypothetical protein
VRRLQVLIQDFNREINSGSPLAENPNFDSDRITELHGHIAELTRGNVDHGDIGDGVRAATPNLPPPAYDADPQLGYLGQMKRNVR